MKLFQKLMKSFGHSFRGLRYAYRKELSFRMEVWAGLILVVIGYLAWPLRVYEFLFLTLSCCFILALELFNTALERTLERLHPEEHELIGKSKDLASGAVLIGVAFAAIVVIAILLSRAFEI